MPGTTRYYHYDASGNTRQLTDSDQNVTDAYVHTGFGEEVAQTGASENSFRWGGRLGYYFDADTGNNYVRARHYQPNNARWMSIDPIRFKGDPSNFFQYVENNPTNFTDPTGLLPFGVFPLTYYPGVTFKNVVGPRALKDGDFDAGDTNHGNWGAKFEFDWAVTPSSFLDNFGSPIACKLVMIQIVKAKLTLRNAGHLANAAAWNASSDWKLDKGTEYPYPTGRNTITHPGIPLYGTRGKEAAFYDTPNTGSYFNSYQIELFKMDFEVHVVAKGGSLGGATFGGYKWGFRYEYEASRYLLGNLSRHFWKQPVTGVSQEYRDLVQYYTERYF